MEDKQDLFDKLMQIKDSYEPDPDLAKKVLAKINQRESTVAFKKPAPKWFWFALVGILVATAVVFLSVYLTRTTDIKITIYSAEQIEVEEIDNLENFISDNNLELKLFKDKYAINSIAKIKDNGAFAYVTQSFDDIGETGFDSIELKVVLLQNAEFEFYSSFNTLNKSTIFQNINVYYTTYESMDNISILAKFYLQDNTYFLEISTNDSETIVLEKYINQLLNQN